MTTLLPSIIDMQRHMASEVDVLRRNVSKLEDSIGRIVNDTNLRNRDVDVRNERTLDVAFDANPTSTHEDIRTMDLKLEQYLAQLQVDHTQKTFQLNDIATKMEEMTRHEQVRSDATLQTLHEMHTQISKLEGEYAMNHGDHIRIDVVSSNLQDITAAIATLNKNLESMDASISQLTATFGTYQTTVNGRLSALEKAVKSVKS